jgi:hypothetical protein
MDWFSRFVLSWELSNMATTVQWIGLIGRQGNAGMRPERRIKPGMDGGLRAAFLISPPHRLSDDNLSSLWGPPHEFCHPLLVILT